MLPAIARSFVIRWTAILTGLALTTVPGTFLPKHWGGIRPLTASAETSRTYAYYALDLQFPGAQMTVPQGMNDNGDFVGLYSDEAGQMRAFALIGGLFVAIDTPGATASIARDINNDGAVVGYFADASGRNHGFLFRDGVMTSLDIDGSTSTVTQGISEAGDIVGEFFTPDAEGIDRSHAFVKQAGVLTVIESPAACCIFPLDVNSRGDVVGAYLDHTGRSHGFHWREGILSTLEVPGLELDQANGINDHNEIVGLYSTEPTIFGVRGFVLVDGQLTTVHFPTGTSSVAGKINNRGEIIGEYSPSNGGTFIAYPATSVTIDIKPGSTDNTINLGATGTVPVAILSTLDFDATTIDPLWVTIAGVSVHRNAQGKPKVSHQDVNEDGVVDLIVHVDISALQLSEADTIATLQARTYSGAYVVGSDSVRVVPKGSHEHLKTE